ncbi:MAG: cbb3-type cytochrome c oxidase N-terminal domain-containing protein [Candidatus Electryonea clarkiae]|nr:cbb3-type cytochrome c oxidase N-terminal domain-containing protein [Candidatus Electryonea clarkiae]MDP8287748.1 cbb3-type cytochrome c oxidase N-terminal domain-containing protein [Candidatus Electryonea clarkiae]
MAKKIDELFDHDFDGIREFDNDLPGWWMWLFVISVIFSFFYIMHFHVLGFGDSSHVKLMKEYNPDYVALPGEQNAAVLANVYPTYKSPFYTPGIDVMQQDLRGGGAAAAGFVFAEEAEVDTSVVSLADAGAIAGGQKIYAQYCFTCHGAAGEGGIGPNLTDEYWINGGSFPEIIHTIKIGVPVKGMIAWSTQLSPEQILEVGSYVNTLAGTNPANAKAPQGEIYIAEK